MWSGLHDLVAGTAVTEMSLPPGVSRHVDLLRLEEPEGDASSGLAEAYIRVWPSTRGPRTRIGTGIYDLELAVVAKDVTARFYRAELTYDGHWDASEEIWSHLRLTSLKQK